MKVKSAALKLSNAPGATHDTLGKVPKNKKKVAINLFDTNMCPVKHFFCKKAKNPDKN